MGHVQKGPAAAHTVSFPVPLPEELAATVFILCPLRSTPYCVQGLLYGICRYWDWPILGRLGHLFHLQCQHAF